MKFAFIAAAVLMSATQVLASPYKEIKDTFVSCSNALTCEINLKAKSDKAVIYSFFLSRAAGPDTPILIKMRSSEPFAEGSEVSIKLDGAEGARFAVADFDYDPDMGEYVAKDTTRGRALLSLMRDSSALAVEFKSTENKSELFSLNGVAGAMLFLDEAQERIGTVDAVEKIGDKPSPVSLIREINSLEALPARIKQDFDTPEASCAFSNVDRFKFGQGFATKIDENNEVYVIPCGEGGAYNQPYALYKVQGDYVEPVHLAVMTDDGPSTTMFAYNVDWDQNTKTLTAFFKGRGIGDCGSLDKWGVRNTDGDASFYLKEARVKDDCDGKDIPADEWPLLWPVK